MNDVELEPFALITIAEARRYVLRSEDDTSRDGQLVDNVNDVSGSVIDHCEREFLETTSPSRSGDDGVANGTTTFVAASGAFTNDDEGTAIYVTDRGLYTIASVTNGTTVVLSGAPETGTDLAWNFGEARVFGYDGSGTLDLRPFDLRELHSLTLYTDLDVDQHDQLDASRYRLSPPGRALGGTYWSIAVPTPNKREAQYGFGWQATVVGQWGMTAVPRSVAFACKQWVKNIFENPGSYATYAMNGYSVTPDVPFVGTGAGMPRAVEKRLERWKRGDRSPMQVVRFRHPDAGQPGVPYAGLPRAN